MSRTPLKIIGLTGGIGSGKSSVSRILRQYGASVLDADALVHQLQSRGQLVWSVLFDAFGWPFFDADGRLARRKMARHIFRNPTLRHELGDLIHPWVRQELLRQMKALQARGVTPIILDIPLLLESGWDQEVDEVWVIYATVSQQRARIIERDGLAPSEADQRIQSQMALAQKVARADRVINNTGSLDQLEREVRTLWEHIGDCAVTTESFVGS